MKQKLQDHPIFTEAFKATLDLSEDTRFLLLAGKSTYQGKEVLFKTHVWLGKFCAFMEQLKYAAGMLSKYRGSAASSGATRYDHIQYAIENFYIRYPSALDRALRAVNEAFGLGFKPRKCRYDNVTNSPGVKGTSVAAALTVIHGTTRKYKNERDIIAHYGNYEDDTLRAIGAYCIARKIDPQKFSKWDVHNKTMADSYVKEKKREFFGDIVVLEKFLYIFFDALSIKISGSQNS
ncbi:MAG: Cthe_2314 family HEPN domain-containing protein [Elusimicrobia bacterium]|nr:Cthe_2314 family HEPN domain-containing protein [Elusimicrobiota bacterium]